MKNQDNQIYERFNILTSYSKLYKFQCLSTSDLSLACSREYNNCFIISSILPKKSCDSFREKMGNDIYAFDHYSREDLLSRLIVLIEIKNQIMKQIKSKALYDSFIELCDFLSKDKYNTSKKDNNPNTKASDISIKQIFSTN